MMIHSKYLIMPLSEKAHFPITALTLDRLTDIICRKGGGVQANKKTIVDKKHIIKGEQIMNENKEHVDVAKVNEPNSREAKLGGEPTIQHLNLNPSGFKSGDLVSIRLGATKYYNGATIPGWVKMQKWYIHEVSGNRAVIDRSENGQYAICSPLRTVDLVMERPARPRM
jgi:hypothetical protein